MLLISRRHIYIYITLLQPLGPQEEEEEEEEKQQENNSRSVACIRLGIRVKDLGPSWLAPFTHSEKCSLQCLYIVNSDLHSKFP
jgi:hypothetical protein